MEMTELIILTGALFFSGALAGAACVMVGMLIAGRRH